MKKEKLMQIALGARLLFFLFLFNPSLTPTKDGLNYAGVSGVPPAGSRWR